MKRRQVTWMLFVVVIGLGGVMYAQNVIFESQIVSLQQSVLSVQQEQAQLSANMPHQLATTHK